MIFVPEAIRHMRNRLDALSHSHIYALLYKDMVDSITVINELPNYVLSTKPLEIFYYANFKTEVLDMVKDCIINTWLNCFPNAMDSTFTDRRSLLCSEFATLMPHCRGPLIRSQSDEAYKRGINELFHYDRETIGIRGHDIWRHGVKQVVNFQDERMKKPTWRNRACLAAFATDISYGEFISPYTVKSWR